MEGFLGQVAADLYDRYGEEVSSLHVVLPSRRAGLFFGEALSGLISRPVWQPHSLTVEQLAGEISGLAAGERLKLVVELYKIWVEYHPAESFDSFYFWGEALLADFDAVDKYLIPADTLFSNLVDLHELDSRFDYLTPTQREALARFWGSFSPVGEESARQRDFLGVWRTLGPVYRRYRERLTELGVAYQGMVYREAAQRIQENRTPPLPDRHYVIAGLGALSRCEQVMFEWLKSHYTADFYWDHDTYYTGPEPAAQMQEAGRFRRDNLRRFPPTGELRGGIDNFSKPKTIRSVAAASDVLQCKYAGLRLAETARHRGLPPGRETAVVLCNEGLLTPLLWSMPPEVSAVNVTMGYPLRLHPAYTFVERLLELQLRRRGGAAGSGSVLFYHSDVEGLVNHPFFGGEAWTGGSRYVYLDAAGLRTTPLFEKIFAAPEGWRATSDYLIEAISAVARLPLEGELDVRRGRSGGGRIEFFALMVDHIRTLATSLDGCGIEPGLRTYASIVRRTLQGVRVPFEGEPLEGVQVMGILETRALDFENVIFLSADDATMPGNLGGTPSFIPYNLKRAYGLPTPEHQESVYAYHFYRLIQRAGNVDVVWSSSSDESGTGEPSRYLLALDYESPHPIGKESVAVDVNLSPTEPIVIPKEARVMERLEAFLRPGEGRRRLSPSLWGCWTECALKFYFRAVAGLRTPDEVAEEVDGALFGNILHRAMELLYVPIVNLADPRARIAALADSPLVEEAVGRAVAELYRREQGAGAGNCGGGGALIHRTVADYIRRGIVPFDSSRPGAFTIERLEEWISTQVAFEGRDGRSLCVVFHGKADRIDSLAGGTLRVVDYKTGSPRGNAAASVQMRLYSMMLGSSGEGKVIPELYYVREMSATYTPPAMEPDPGFEEELRASLAELFDRESPFTQCADPKPCAWCDFNVICRR